ncbi:MAG: hypothetical protein R2685_12945 [Candidatus Nitrosocosmicus sp.]|nr:hypothetical protein [Candidatus Nitrosocosmicus sp.]
MQVTLFRVCYALGYSYLYDEESSHRIAGKINNNSNDNNSNTTFIASAKDIKPFPFQKKVRP